MNTANNSNNIPSEFEFDFDVDFDSIFDVSLLLFFSISVKFEEISTSKLSIFEISCSNRSKLTSKFSYNFGNSSLINISKIACKWFNFVITDLIGFNTNFQSELSDCDSLLSIFFTIVDNI